VRLNRIPRSASAHAMDVAGRSSLDAVAEPGLATQFEPDPSRSPLSSLGSPRGGNPCCQIAPRPRGAA
jgi:hypothetical protein